MYYGNPSFMYLKTDHSVQAHSDAITFALTKSLPSSLEKVEVFFLYLLFLCFFPALSFANKRVVKSNVYNNLTDYLLIRY